MQWLQIVTLVAGLVQMVEQAYGEIKGQGQVKKQVVTNAAQTIVTGAQSVSTGGQANTWNKVAGALPALIDAAVGVMNGMSEVISGKDVIDTGTATSGHASDA